MKTTKTFLLFLWVLALTLLLALPTESAGDAGRASGVTYAESAATDTSAAVSAARSAAPPRHRQTSDGEEYSSTLTPAAPIGSTSGQSENTAYGYTLTLDGGVYTLTTDSGARAYSGSLDGVSDFLATRPSVSLFLDMKEAAGTLRIATDVNIRGTCSFSDGGIVVSGGRLVSSAEITFSSGGLRIKEGTLTVTGGSLVSASSVIVSDYSSSVSVSVTGGEIVSQGREPAIKISLGTLSLSGGSVKCAYGFAVDNRGSLSLSGSPVIRGTVSDISTSGAVTLFGAEGSFSGTVRVICTMDFPLGSLTPVFYSADGEQTKSITLTDSRGTSLPLTYFSSSRYTDERDFLAVYRPHTVTFYAQNGEKYRTEELLSGESPTLPEPPERVGYSFFGWCADTAGDTPYTPEGVYENISLYAVYRLSAPTFLSQNITFTFDGEWHTISPVVFSHPLDGEGHYEYLWYRDGAATDITTPTLRIRDVRDSGEYSLSATFFCGNERVTVSVPAVTVSVSPLSVDPPEIPSATYTGLPLLPAVPSCVWYGYSFDPVIHAGEYPVILELKDPGNTVWRGGDFAALSLTFRVLTADNLWTITPEISDVYGGEPAAVCAAARFGVPEWRYSVSPDGGYSPDFPTAPGTYYAVCTVPGTSDVREITTVPIRFTVMRDGVLSLRIAALPDRTEYSAYDFFDPAGLSVIALRESGRSGEIPLSELVFSYTGGAEYFLFGDKTVNVTYSGRTCSVPVIVRLAEYDMSGFLFSDTTIIYDGGWHTISPSNLPAGLLYSTDVSARDAGEYTVTLTFTSTDRNRRAPDPVSATLTINPRPLTVIWGECEFVYDGAPKLPGAYAIMPDGYRRTLAVTGARTNAGEGYVAAAQAPDGNHTLTNPTAAFFIARASYDMSGVHWSASELVYDGQEHSVTLAALPAGISVIGYSGSVATAAGEYTATATLGYDSENYYPPEIQPLVWHILRADYDLGGLSFVGGEFVYDGLTHLPTVTGEIPAGYDGSVPEYTMTAGATHVSEGEVAVYLRFIVTSKNYNTPKDLTAYVRIVPCRVGVVWEKLTFVYDGREHLPSSSAVCPLRVTGGATDAGSYIAMATPLTSDYVLTNPTVAFTVERRANMWTEQPRIPDIFDGDTPLWSAAAEYGEAAVTFFLDEDCTAPAEGFTPGTYYAVFTVPESRNYKALVSSPVRFLVVKIAPVGISAECEGEIVAFSPVSALRAVVRVLYNNGDVRTASPDEYTVSYPSGHLPHTSDTTVIFTLGEFSVTKNITVGRAVLDLSTVRYTGLTVTYDGEEHTPGIASLPEGVTVLRIDGGARVAAGVYSVSVTLGYDSENYLDPGVLHLAMTIEKKTVVLPTPPEFSYTGRAYIPKFPESGLYDITAPEVLHAGTYRARAALRDRDNYRFAGADGGECEFTFTVSPAYIRVIVGNVTKYIDGIKGGLTYVSAAPIPDEAGLRLYTDGGLVLAAFDNPDYYADCVPGRINPVARLSPSLMTSFVILAVILIFLLILAVALPRLIPVIKERIRIASVAANIRRNTVCPCAPITVPRLAPPDNRGGVENSPAPDTLPGGTSESGDADIPAVKPDAETPAVNGRPATETGSRTAVRRLLATRPVTPAYADAMITDSDAKEMTEHTEEVIYTSGHRRRIINVGTLSRAFPDGARVDVNILKERSLVPYDTGYLKVLADGVIDKELSVYADAFSLAAVKMIALTGGRTIKAHTEQRQEPHPDEKNVAGAEKE